jgi:hypothetical protein
VPGNGIARSLPNPEQRHCDLPTIGRSWAGIPECYGVTRVGNKSTEVRSYRSRFLLEVANRDYQQAPEVTTRLRSNLCP